MVGERVKKIIFLLIVSYCTTYSGKSKFGAWNWDTIGFGAWIYKRDIIICMCYSLENLCNMYFVLIMTVQYFTVKWHLHSDINNLNCHTKIFFETFVQLYFSQTVLSLHSTLNYATHLYWHLPFLRHNLFIGFIWILLLLWG